MFSRWSTVAVILFWGATMGWLFKEKVLPSLLVGQPPSYRTILAVAHDKDEDRPIAWDIQLNDRRLGRAITQVYRHPEGITELRSRVYIDELPLAELTSAPIASVLKLLSGNHRLDTTLIGLHAGATIDVDPLGRLLGFRSLTRLGPGNSVFDPDGAIDYLSVNMKGTVEGDNLNVSVQMAGAPSTPTSVRLPPDALMTDMLAPPSRLPGLRVGQSWTVPIYNPFASAAAPMEVLHATVERREPIQWHDMIVPTLVVVYRVDPGQGLSGNQAARAQVWVDQRGEVIKQELAMLSSKLKFTRCTSEENASLSNLSDDLSKPDGRPPRFRRRWHSETTRVGAVDDRIP